MPMLDGILSVEDLELEGTRVFIRVDFNVPLDKKTRTITDDERIQAALPTIRYVIEQGAKVILASHLGRPKGKAVPELSMEPVAARLAELGGFEVHVPDDCIGDAAKKVVQDLRDGQVCLLENLRYHDEEEANDEAFAKELADLARRVRERRLRGRAPRPRLGGRAAQADEHPRHGFPARKGNRVPGQGGGVAGKAVRRRARRREGGGQDRRDRVAAWRSATPSASAAPWPTRCWPHAART